jgi:antitoxin YefM
MKNRRRSPNLRHRADARRRRAQCHANGCVVSFDFYLYSVSVRIIEERRMPIQTTYTDARANFAKLCDRVVSDLDVAIITRRGAEDVALIPASELASLLETAHLLRSPKNADRLWSALKRAQARAGAPQSVTNLRRELGLDDEA